MRAAVIALTLVALAAFGSLAVGGAASAACVTPTPNPSQTSAGIALQVGETTETPSPIDTCAPSATAPAGAILADTTAGDSAGTKTPRKAVPASIDTPQTAPAGASGAPTPGTEPVPQADALVLSPGRVGAGEKVLATGAGYAAGERVQVVVYSNPVILGSYTADSSGHLNATFTVPVDIKTGAHTVEATGWVSHHATNGRLLVVTAAVVEGRISPTWWLIGIGILLLSVILVSLIVFRSTIARAFTPSKLPEAAS